MDGVIHQRGDWLAVRAEGLDDMAARVVQLGSEVIVGDFSIGVELEGSDTQPFTADQYQALVVLTRALRKAYPLRDIVGHADIAPGRKTDPGSHFDWEGYRKALISTD